MKSPQAPTPAHRDLRRILVLALSLVLLVAGGLGRWFEGESSVPFAADASIRIGLILGALWLAWPSLRRPASWLPPGAAVLGVIALAVVAARPRLIVVALPAVGLLISMAAIVRAVRRSGR